MTGGVCGNTFHPWGWGTALPLPVCSRLLGWSTGACQLGDGGEGLGWLSSSSTHPVPGAHHLPGTLPQSQAGLFSPAPSGGGGFSCHSSSTRDPVEFTTLLLNIGEYPSIHLSQCTAAGTK